MDFRQRYLMGVLLGGFILNVSALCGYAQNVPEVPLADAVSQLERVTTDSQTLDSPESVREKTSAAAGQVLTSAARVARRVAEPQQHLNAIHQLHEAKSAVDDQIKRLLKKRSTIASLAGDEQRLESARKLLSAIDELIDLSGRLNYQLQQTIFFASHRFTRDNKQRAALVQRLADDESVIGTSLAATMLIDPPKNSTIVAATPEIKSQILRMLGRHGRQESLPWLLRFLESDPPATLKLLACDAIVRVGLPQNSLENAADDETPSITAAKLQEQLETIPPKDLSPSLRGHREVLINWLGQRIENGVNEQGYALGQTVLQPGDWILFRNPSPYNRFSQLTPGLFTHVGIVTLHTDADGYQRMVLVDLNERQTRIDGRNVETTLTLPLYYGVLRHSDPEVRQQMAVAAADMIGNEARFDLTFDTNRIDNLRETPLADQKIDTYCVGIVMLCAQRTDQPREEFFPIPEAVTTEQMAENLDRIGLQIGEGFRTPTGALFAKEMELVHLSEPMYDPGREIQQRIYDHFASRLNDSSLRPQQTLYQSLRIGVADLATDRPVLADALAAAAGVDRETDLAAAARAVAVVESLDAIAQSNSRDFNVVYRRIMQGPKVAPPAADSTDAQRKFAAEREELVKRHQQLAEGLWQRKISPATLETKLQNFYITRGQAELDKAFFPEVAPPAVEKAD
ncbi:HEAT repeat domain-containing protein [Thalassoroseus pseudoceratinae]|uniref:HEAT repeat domain-containing protein n=1 Tax=Thalassoroseus pseudoceratinae TaxID=2713176 RepID=UPI001420B694|nr:HEAT repeat domain-containing protein [Thalassoroseus pseudoceratinae]